MSIVCDSPPSSQTDSYFTPRAPTYSSQDPDSNDESPSTGQTPFFTAPISPTINQEFFAAIQNRGAYANYSHPPTTSRSSASNGSLSAATDSSLRDRSPSAIPLSLSSSIANRRKGSMSGTPSSSPAASSISSKLTTFTAENVASLFDEPASSNPEPLAPSSDPLKARHHKFTHPLLLIDIRNVVQYGESHIRGAINVCIPNMILKRPTFNLEKMVETLLVEDDKIKLSQCERHANIVLYDSSSESLGDNSTISIVAQKFLAEGYAGGLGWLRGGIGSLVAAHPDLLITHVRTTAAHAPVSLPAEPPSSSLAGSGTTSVQANHNAPSLARRAQLAFGPFTAPVTPFENQTFNPFFSNIRQNMELSKDGVMERIPVRLPANVEFNGQEVRGARIVRAKYPSWLLDVIRPGGEGEQKLAKMYEQIEKAEQQRLQNIMLHSSKSSTNATEHPMSICAGLEKGALNRYTNTWPYEYTRVKISECTADQTDYINASYVHYSASPAPSDSKLGSKRKDRLYIATQGPLPTTFTDFWKMVWEQRSRVLVMLTREEEMNRIKCHRYWPQEVNETQDFEPLVVTLLSQTIKQVGRDPTDVMITRVFNLSHRGHAESEAFEVTQIQFVGWMDFGVPDDPIGVLKVVTTADLAQKRYQSIEGASVGPMVVHCSAGCGRSGSFCTVDTVLGLLEDDDDSDHDGKQGDIKDLVCKTVEKFREQRVSMVQTLRQFVFCYEAIWWALLGFGEDDDHPASTA